MMFLENRRSVDVCFFLVTVVLFAGSPARAQSNRADGGFSRKVAAGVTGAELSTQSNLWVLDVSFKTMRMVSVELTDPRTREKKREWVWYLFYKAVRQPIKSRGDTTDTQPVNSYDGQPKPPRFVPEFTLMTMADQNGKIEIINDTIIPEAEPIIGKREKPAFKNTVDVVQTIPDVTPVGAPAKNVIYGVAMWQGVDPKTDYFTVFMSGFSNGYRVVKGPDGRSLIERRTIVQEFWRPGDRFDQAEIEIRFKGDPKWVYRADEPKQAATSEKPPVPPADRKDGAAAAASMP
jgi:hypothetical protein